MSRPEWRGRVALLLLACSALPACSPEQARRPFGLEQRPVQRFRLEANDVTRVDETPVRVERVADVRLEADPNAADGVLLFVERYWMRVEGAPGGATELAISERGVVTRGGEAGELRLAPDAAGPAGRSVLETLASPASGVRVTPGGGVRGSVWQSYDPLLAEVQLLGWLLLALPELADGAPQGRGSREAPQIGRYRLGIQLPLFYQRDGERVLASGDARRSELRLAPELLGSVDLSHKGESTLAEQGWLASARLELVMQFRAADGSEIESTHRVRLSCKDCES